MEQSPLQPTPVGAFRFNTDSSKLEYYDGNQWVNITSTPAPAAPRWVTCGGYQPGVSDIIQYAQINTTGNTTDFGNLTESKIGAGACASATRGLNAGTGEAPADTDVIDYITIATAGNATDFGDLPSAMGYTVGTGDKTRGLFIGGADTPTYSANNEIKYVTYSSTGDTTDFGDYGLTVYNINACSSPTRGIIAGGNTNDNRMEYVTIQSTGNSVDFGDTIAGVRLSGAAGTGNATRGMFGGGNYGPSPTITAMIQYFQFSTLGNCADFGDLTVARNSGSAGSSATRAVWGGGRTGPPAAEALKDTMDYVEIMSLGKAVDFGNLIAAVRYNSGFSNTNGGVQG